MTSEVSEERTGIKVQYSKVPFEPKKYEWSDGLKRNYPSCSPKMLMFNSKNQHIEGHGLGREEVLASFISYGCFECDWYKRSLI